MKAVRYYEQIGLITPDREHNGYRTFGEHHVQLPLTKGDAVFFNPALFHAAGSNTTSDVRRMANLLQISSAFGRAMDAVDRADLGDEDAELAVGDAEDHDLAWYATQELPFLLELL